MVGPRSETRQYHWRILRRNVATIFGYRPVSELGTPERPCSARCAIRTPEIWTTYFASEAQFSQTLEYASATQLYISDSVVQSPHCLQYRVGCRATFSHTAHTVPQLRQAPLGLFRGNARVYNTTDHRRGRIEATPLQRGVESEPNQHIVS